MLLNAIRTYEDLQAEKELISPPGHTLQETLEARNIHVEDFADRVGFPVSFAESLISGKETLDAATALLLERHLGIPADFWLEKERRYRLKLEAIFEAEKRLRAT